MDNNSQMGNKPNFEDGGNGGRKPKRIDLLRFTEVLKEVKEGKKTAKEGAAQLGISIDKYYRERRKLQKENDKLLQ